MTTTRPKGILNKIDADGTAIWDSSKLSVLLREQVPQLTNEERLELVSGLVNRNIFRWLDYVSSELRALASLEDSYVDFLSDVVNKVRLDMAQGPIIESLISIGADSPQLGIDLSFAMRKRNDEALALYSAFPLGGAGRSALNEVEAVIDGLWQSEATSNRVAALRSYRVIYGPHKGEKKEIPLSVLKLVDAAAFDRELSVRQEATHALFDFAEIDEGRSMKTLIKLAQTDQSIHELIVNRLRLQNKLKTENIVTLLKLIVEDDNDSVLGEIASVLAFRGAEFQREAMEMILSMVARGKYHKVHLLDYAAEQVAKPNVSDAIKLVEGCLEKEDRKDQALIAPYLLIDISKSDYLALADHIADWLRDKPEFEDVSLRTARELLGRAFKANNVAVGERLYPALAQYATQKGLDVERTIRGEPDRIAQCVELILAIETLRDSIDYDKIESTLDKFPSIRDFLGKNWIRRKKSEGNRYHPLLYYLEDLPQESELEKLESEPIRESTPMKILLKSLTRSNLLRPRAMLTHLDDITREVGQLANTGNLRYGLRADDQFLSAFSELQILHAFIKAGHRTVIGPSVKNRKLDLETTIDGTEILFEVIRPGVFRRLRYSSGAIVIPNRVRSMVREEVKRHLPGYSSENKKPIVIIIDIGSSEIDYDSVIDCLYGTSQFTFTTDKKTRKVVDKGWTRANDSLHAKNLDIISGILAYKTVVGDDGRAHLQGKLLPNLTALNPLTDAQISSIEYAVFK